MNCIYRNSTKMDFQFNFYKSQHQDTIGVTLDLGDFPDSTIVSICCFCDLLGKVPLLPSRNLAFLNFANSVMVLCLTWNYYMLTTFLSYFTVDTEVWWKIILVALQLQVNFILHIAAFSFSKIHCVKKSAVLHNYLTTIKVLGVNIFQ